MNEKGERIIKIIEHWALPQNRMGAKDDWWNAQPPFIETAQTGELMCDAFLRHGL